jgi:hypothetical protein
MNTLLEKEVIPGVEKYIDSETQVFCGMCKLWLVDDTRAYYKIYACLVWALYSAEFRAKLVLNEPVRHANFVLSRFYEYVQLHVRGFSLDGSRVDAQTAPYRRTIGHLVWTLSCDYVQR